MITQFAVFQIPGVGTEQESELNRFMRSHTVLQCETGFRSNTGGWSVLVHYALSPANGTNGGAPGPKIDYRAVLSAEDFSVFDRLRQLRKAVAEEKGLAVYAVCSNAQLATMATERPATRAALQLIEGFGEAKSASFGDAFLEVLNASPPRGSTTTVDATPTTRT